MHERVWVWIVVLVLGIAVVLAADPNAPDTLSVASSSRRAFTTSATAQAEAGNVSELNINTTTVTQGWQGYFGNISGTIVLDDAVNNSMYTWDLADPEGEVYATRNSTVNWTRGNIMCANITHIQNEESMLNFNLGTGQDVDGVNETFSQRTHPQFNVSSTGFASSQCNYSISTYVNDAPGPRYFNETLIYSRSDGGLIYTALIVQGGADGFRVGSGDSFDFQMLVAEDGHTNSNPTSYYFYVEIS